MTEEYQEVGHRLYEAIHYGPPQYSSLFQEALERINRLTERVDILEEGLRAVRYTLQNEAVLSTDAGTKIVVTHLINVCTETLEGK